MNDDWHDQLIGEWPMPRSKPGESFGIKIAGLLCGCWHNDEPYWGFNSEKGNPTEEQKRIAAEIIERAGIK